MDFNAVRENYLCTRKAIEDAYEKAVAPAWLAYKEADEAYRNIAAPLKAAYAQANDSKARKEAKKAYDKLVTPYKEDRDAKWVAYNEAVKAPSEIRDKALMEAKMAYEANM
jgi:Fe-S cluster assembly scaffold protein SufB